MRGLWREPDDRAGGEAVPPTPADRVSVGQRDALLMQPQLQRAVAAVVSLLARPRLRRIAFALFVIGMLILGWYMLFVQTPAPYPWRPYP